MVAQSVEIFFGSCDRNHNSQPLDSLMNPFSSLKLCFFKVIFNIILRSRTRCCTEETLEAVLSKFIDVSAEYLAGYYLYLLNDSEGGETKRLKKSTKLNDVTPQKIALSSSYKCLNTKCLK
jgi:hypothetical protein